MKGTKHPLISLCMIVKNEESNILRCLTSVKDYVDEILILDTGSSDRTPVLAQEQGARVFFGRWENNFAKARNKIKQHARGEWIFYLDADEEVPPETGRSLRQLAQHTKAEALTFSIINYTSAANVQKCRGLNIRMFKNNPKYCFEGALHEQIAPSILRNNPSASIVYSGLEILHYGYSLDHPKRTQKNQRNITILECMLAENPKDDFTHYNLGVSFYVSGQLENAKHHFHLAKQYASKNSHYLPGLYRNFTVCLVDLGEYEEALKLSQEGLSFFPDYPDLYYLQGQIYSAIMLFELALERFRQCLKYNKINPNYISMEGVQSFLAYEQMADIYMRLQDWEEALQHQVKAVQTGGTSYTSFLRLGLLAKQYYNNPEDTINFLQLHLPQLSPEERIKLLFDMGEYHLVLREINDLPQPTPENYIIAAKSAIYLKKWQLARNFLSQIPPSNEEIAILASICRVLSNDIGQTGYCHMDQSDRFLAQLINQEEILSGDDPITPSLFNFAYQLVTFDESKSVKYLETIINPSHLSFLYSQLGQQAFTRNNYNLAERLFSLSLIHQKKVINYKWFGLINIFTGDILEGIRFIRHSCNLEKDSQNYISLLTALTDFFQQSLRHLVVNCPHISTVHQHLSGLARFKKKLTGKEEILCQ
ncbi:TPR domain-containing glycosyltransferase [Desulforamulus putei]|uniref:Tetratricopeptide repeat-containing protein n=1 Tax=Desulforamulus putei DSM 12395 TaxID=1121429 RepID=A0A1M4S8N5_9FIRM|nr:TPR domain-containing glycosyltransferase [Desulforamulus putei]SHE28560.1 Tetratricopeptide repeat-containing protein [Desulforamulus putei DSM 12395]